MAGKKDKPWVYIPVNKGHKAKVDKEDLKKVMAHTWRILPCVRQRSSPVYDVGWHITWSFSMCATDVKLQSRLA